MTDDDADADRGADLRAAWEVYQIADLLHRMEARVDAALRGVGRADPEEERARFLLRREAVADTRGLLDEILDLVEQAQARISRLPDTDIIVRYEDAAREALRELGDGDILDGDRALLAGRLARGADGLRALAQGLRASDAHKGWDVRLETLLRTFDRPISLEAIAQIASRAGLGRGADVALSDADETARLASLIEEYAEQRPPT